MKGDQRFTQEGRESLRSSTLSGGEGTSSLVSAQHTRERVSVPFFFLKDYDKKFHLYWTREPNVMGEQTPTTDI